MKRLSQYNTCFWDIFGYLNLNCEKMACPINMKFLGQGEILDYDILQFNLSMLVLQYLLHNCITLDKIKKNNLIWADPCSIQNG